MATFECPSLSNNKASESCTKYPIKRLEPSIQKFVKILKIDIERLDKHKRNIEKFQRLCEWDKVNTEQINASRTVQQVKANIRALEQTRNQVDANDAEQFEKMICGIHEESLQSVATFLASSGIRVPQTEDSSATPCGSSEQSTSVKKGSFSNHMEESEASEMNTNPSPPRDRSHLQQLQARPENSQVAESWEHLQESLWELNIVMREFSRMVHKQQGEVDSIEDNVEHAAADVQAGTGYLAQASKLKAALYPVAGAVLGGVIMGPVGLVAGAKMGSLAAVAGGIAGFTSGKFLKSAQDKAVDTEMENLSANEMLTVKTNSRDTEPKST